MSVQFCIASSGDLHGVLHFRVDASEEFNVNETIDYINEFPTLQPRVVVVHDNGATDVQIMHFLERVAKKQPINPFAGRHLVKVLNGFELFVLVTNHDKPRNIWQRFHRVVLITTPNRYTGVPVDELHLIVNPNTDSHPVIPHQLKNTIHIYAIPRKASELEDLVEWVRACDYPIGIVKSLL